MASHELGSVRFMATAHLRSSLVCMSSFQWRAGGAGGAGDGFFGGTGLGAGGALRTADFAGGAGGAAGPAGRNWNECPQRGHVSDAAPLIAPGGKTCVQVGLGQGRPVGMEVR